MKEDKKEIFPFCWNSRRWLFFNNPSSCPKESWEDCDFCGYYEERILTRHAKRIVEILRNCK